MAKIVIADSDFVVSDIEQKMIEDAGIEFARFQDKSAAGIVKNCADAEGIITAYGEFPREVFAALPKLGWFRDRALATIRSILQQQANLAWRYAMCPVTRPKWYPIMPSR